MSAVEEYRAFVGAADGYATRDLADAAIAELEAEVQHQIERREEEKLRAIDAESSLTALRFWERG